MPRNQEWPAPDLWTPADDAYRCHSSKGRLDRGQRRKPAGTLTDVVLVPEVGRFASAARIGFQVHFVEREPDMMAIGCPPAPTANPTSC
ncbi:hypothetical protein [Streptomyces mirabilis]|uniref:hypothetical protein n=1 Tax=Streptomyces mirabilis TaxID=68239 RepID=UPI0033A1F84C